MGRPLWTVAVILTLGGFGLARYVGTLQADEPVIDRTSDAWQMRLDALSRSSVFVADAPRVGETPLDTNPHDPRPFARDARLTCDYVPGRASGTTPKFDCRLPNGDIVKVKYGRTPEIHAEVAATRLLAALGFAADHVSLVSELECRGCPPAPYHTRKLAQLYFLSELYDRVLPFQARRVYRQVAVERKFTGESIEVGDYEGWQWGELGALRPERGAATRAEVDALRLIAVVLGHWDNKSTNQRLVCTDPERDRDSGVCAHPVLMLQDLGSTFGPRKVNLEAWAEVPVWTDPDACLVSMRELPYAGATFVDAEISEAGRRTLSRRLRSLSAPQLQALFEGAAFPDASGAEPEGRSRADVTAWVQAMQDKMRQVTDRPPCPDHGSRGTSP